MPIRLGIVGCEYGSSVLAPAFLADARCRVVAIAASRGSNAQAAAARLGVEHAYGDGCELLKHAGIDAVAVATPPAVQPEIVCTALKLGFPVFAEKPLAVGMAEARRMAEMAVTRGLANMVDFNFTALTGFERARSMLRRGEIGGLRHLVVNWQTESYTNRAVLGNWKSNHEQGGGSLSNFVSHCLYYLEWLVAPVAALSARLFRMPGDRRPGETTVSLALEFAGGASGTLAMSAAAIAGAGHRIEFYGDQGALALENASSDYMRGFRLFHCRRPSTSLEEIDLGEPDQDGWPDGRVLPTSRLARRFLDWVERGAAAHPDFQDGLRVQVLMDAARRSHDRGQWVQVPRLETGKQ